MRNLLCLLFLLPFLLGCVDSTDEVLNNKKSFCDCIEMLVKSSDEGIDEQSQIGCEWIIEIDDKEKSDEVLKAKDNCPEIAERFEDFMKKPRIQMEASTPTKKNICDCLGMIVETESDKLKLPSGCEWILEFKAREWSEYAFNRYEHCPEAIERYVLKKSLKFLSNCFIYSE